MQKASPRRDSFDRIDVRKTRVKKETIYPIWREFANHRRKTIHGLVVDERTGSIPVQPDGRKSASMFVFICVIFRGLPIN
jgi:hypothetical protein